MALVDENPGLLGKPGQADAPTTTLTVTYKGVPHTLTFPPAATLADLRETLSTTPDILLPPTSQKLVIKGKSSYPDTTLLSALPTVKLMLIGSTTQEINKVQKNTSIAQARAARVQAARKAIPSSSSSGGIHTIGTNDLSSYTFHTLTPLPNFADASRALNLLTRLRDDTGIHSIMQKHQWSVGALIELHPAERTILGYNQNKGQLIALRLRTDDLDGFRHFDSIRKVLLHELSHMVHSEHDAKFHQLNRELNKECDLVNTGRTAGDGKFYNPPEEEAVDEKAFEGGVFVLGGSTVVSGGGHVGSGGGSDASSMREVLARAALGRLTKEEEEMVEGCGSRKEFDKNE
ncbi:hypothetical protein HDV00_009141 [Rhizophlyctis rosea]|nr:hypothetical protein HDV00_009141 [Rhizophlyctis rosea]